MFKKILIANRGEIACRVIKSAQKMGIKTVAVYSDADARAMHTEMADEAVHIGPSVAAQSYLIADKIIAACKQTGAEAVHPGYGFLSEKASFMQALAKEGIAFIGPGEKAIKVMGDKIESKIFAAEAGVSTVPGSPDVIEDADHALKIAGEIGYPVMIKASAGGGGKGMRVAWDEAEAREGFARAKSEAANAFGDDRILIEKFIVNPRHIEIQILADKAGNTVYLHERECSIQRRNQKVVEEAPSSFLDAATRKAMGEQSVALAKACGYHSAGTVEFIVDVDRNFYFLEMNTRLQVEHPVTELITGVDLVEQMIRVAAGENLPFTQKDLKINGWAIESRIYAEDPFKEFLPSIGRLRRFNMPSEKSEGGITLRNDTGVTEGSDISMYYDPMISKLCTHAPTREAATDAMAEALDQSYIDGIQHNIPFLSSIMQHPRWRSGNISTNFIAEEFPDGFDYRIATADEKKTIAILASLLTYREKRRQLAISGQLDEHLEAPTDWHVVIDRETYPVDIATSPATLEWSPGDRLAKLIIGDTSNIYQVTPQPGGWKISFRDLMVQVFVCRPALSPLLAHMPEKVEADTSNMLICPMPGVLTSLLVKEGDIVQAGQSLAILEAMKMENVLHAVKKAIVTKIHAEQGAQLAVDTVIMEFEAC
ncbi:acetyl-CoA carboxylase biotin carboxylase subunit [Kordiimonas pumila]|uniref:propionyl-CoA carboxylase n=1 Tax=Kordiimonas pumila TaxID=2161677 RepID=A0ABV7D4B4_9PROT|nr:acetyl/propionyl/methylcrotonyl-CoA carboxylase subunit alpha [Kordiimonas pumila]